MCQEKRPDRDGWLHTGDLGEMDERGYVRITGRLKDGSKLSTDTIAAYVGERVAPEKAPHYYRIVSRFPMTRSGKIQKFKLAQMASNL